MTRIDRLKYILTAHFVDCSETGIDRSNAMQPSGLRVDRAASRRGNTFVTPEQKQFQRSTGTVFSLEHRKNIGSGNPAFNWNAQEPCNPDDRHAVCETKIAEQQ